MAYRPIAGRVSKLNVHGNLLGKKETTKLH